MSEVVNKKVLAELISEQTGSTKKDALETVELVFDTISSQLTKGNKVDISGFGKFEVKVRAARTGINPHTRESIKIAESKSLGFKAAKALKDSVNNK